MSKSKTIYKRKKFKEPHNQSLIPNSQLENMFLSIADDEMTTEYRNLVNKGLVGTATAYASHRVYKFFMYWRDNFIKQNGDLEYLAYMLYKRGK